MKHGDRSYYVTHHCKCKDCRYAHSSYVAKRRATNMALAQTGAYVKGDKGLWIRSQNRRKSTRFSHGTPKAYEWWGCRCDECTEAARQRWRERKQNARLKREEFLLTLVREVNGSIEEVSTEDVNTSTTKDENG